MGLVPPAATAFSPLEADGTRETLGDYGEPGGMLQYRSKEADSATVKVQLMEEFIVPAEPGELWSDACDLPFKVQDLQDLDEAAEEEIAEIAENLSFSLCSNDPLCLVEQGNFDQLCSLLRAWPRLAGPARRRLLDGLCSSLTCLTAWMDPLLKAPPEELDRESVITNRSAFKAYIFFLQWLSEVAGREAREAEAAAGPTASSAASTATSRGRKKAAAAAAAAAVPGWDWAVQFPKVVKSMATALNTDLRKLFLPNRPEEGLMMKAIQLSTAALEVPTTGKDETLAGHAAHALGVCALKYDQLEVVASSLAELVTKYEHTPDLVAELLRYSTETWADTRLAAAVIAELAAVDPAEYERQQKATGEKAGARSVAAFVESLAERLPRVVDQQLPLLLPHLGGEAHTLRSGIVFAIGSVLRHVYNERAGKEANQQGDAIRSRWVKSKQHLLEVLGRRIADKSAFVRKDVLKTWQTLAAAKDTVPIGHWGATTNREGIAEMTVDRLQDKSPLVRKEALRLLRCLMHDNPFLDTLSYEKYAAALREHEPMLERLERSHKTSGGEAWQELEIQQPAGGEAAAGEQEVGTEDAEARNDSVGAEGEAAEGEGCQAARGEPAEKEMQDADPAGKGEGEAPAAKDEHGQQDEAAAPQEPPAPALTPAEVGWHATVEELEALVATLKTATQFTHEINTALPVLEQLLASQSATEVQDTILVLLSCKQFNVDGVGNTIKKMLPLIFSREQNVKDHIVEALDQLYVTGWAGNMFNSEQAARNLIDLASGATLGELGSLEEVIKDFVHKGFITPVLLHEMWGIADKAFNAVVGNAAQAGRAHKDLRAALALLSMVAATQPQVFSKHHLASLLRYGFSSRCPDALITRHACVALQRLADNFQTGAYDDILDQAFAALTRTVIVSPLPEASWFSAAECALSAIYALHPAPEQLCAAILRHMAGVAFQSRAVEAAMAAAPGAAAEGEEGLQEEVQVPSFGGSGQQQPAAYSTSALSRFFFVLGHVALQHLVYVERVSKAVRRARFDAEKKAANEGAEKMTSGNSQPGEDQEDINSQLGVGSVAADAELDAMKEASERQILAMSNLLGPYSQLVEAVFHNRELFGCNARLRSSVLLALTKLMLVDEAFCEKNLMELIKRLDNKTIDEKLRSNTVIAVGDLALRFPNTLEPYTEFIYKQLDDTDVQVKKNTLMVLTHLILNDMMKVKGHISKMAKRLEDDNPRIVDLARLFFSELAKKEYKGTNPIYNLLPDILSNLSKEHLDTKKFQSIMHQLLAHIQKDKMGDSLMEKLCQRFAATEDVRQWRDIAFCMSQLPSSEKGLKKLCESFKLYKHALHDEEVAEAIKGIFAKAKKGSAKMETKALIEDFEQKLSDYAAERAEEERTAEAARKDAERRRGGGQRAASGESESGAASDDSMPAGSELVSEMRGQMAGLDISAEGALPANQAVSGEAIKPDPDGPPEDGASQAHRLGTGDKEEEGGPEQEKEEEEEPPEPPPGTHTHHSAPTASTASTTGGGRASRGHSSSRAAGGAASASTKRRAVQRVVPDSSDEEEAEGGGAAGDSEGEEGQLENTSAAANRGRGRTGAAGQEASGKRSSTRHRPVEEAGLAEVLANIKIEQE